MTSTTEAERRLAQRAAMGLVCVIYLGFADPFCGFGVLTPWTGWGFRAWVDMLIGAALFALAVSMPLAVGLRSRPGWYATYFKAVSGLLLIAWSVLLLFAALYSFGIVALAATPDARVFAGVGFVGLLIGALAAGTLVGILRRPFWSDPATRPAPVPRSRRRA